MCVSLTPPTVKSLKNNSQVARTRTRKRDLATLAKGKGPTRSQGSYNQFLIVRFSLSKSFFPRDVSFIFIYFIYLSFIFIYFFIGLTLFQEFVLSTVSERIRHTRQDNFFISDASAFWFLPYLYKFLYNFSQVRWRTGGWWRTVWHPYCTTLRNLHLHPNNGSLLSSPTSLLIRLGPSLKVMRCGVIIWISSCNTWLQKD